MTGEALRLNKAIARAGIASRREADRLIREGRVRLNGEVVSRPGRTMAPGVDRLEVAGQRVRVSGAPLRELWALYKPKRCVSTLHDPQGRASLATLLPPSRERLFPVGRLDYDAEGLILLTNDGDLAQRAAHPGYGVERAYLVKVKGLVQPEALRALARGPVLEGRRRGGVRARILHTHNDKTWLEVTLREGIQHHIKKMFAAAGHRVLKIKRYRIGPVELGDLEPGQWRKLGRTEMAWLLGRTRRAPPRRRRSAGAAPGA